MDTTSITFIPSFTNFPFSGAPANLIKNCLTLNYGRNYLSRYSRVNHAMLIVSTSPRIGFSTRLPSISVYCNPSRVLIVIPTIEIATNSVDMMEISCQLKVRGKGETIGILPSAALLLSECSIKSHSIFWCLAYLPVPKSSSAS